MEREVILTLGGFKFIEYFKDFFSEKKKKIHTMEVTFATWACSKSKLREQCFV